MSAIEDEIDVSDDAERPAEKPVDVSVIKDTKSVKTPDRVYTREEKLRACVVWVTCGTVNGTATRMGLGREVVRKWVNSKWWPVAVEEARRRFEEEITGNLSEIMDLAQTALKARLVSGDTRVFANGTEAKVPVGAKDLAVIQAIAFDKRQIISGRPTSIRSGAKSAVDRAAELRNRAAPKKAAAEPAGGSNVVSINKAAS